MTRRVFVVQNQHHRNRQTGELEPKFDFSPAEEFGEINFLLGANASPFNLDPLIEDLKVRLGDYSRQDHLLLVGSPTLIGLAVAIAARQNNGDVFLLQWNGKSRKYFSFKALDLFTS